MIRRVLVGAVRGWRRFVSPLYGPRCRYHPSCSAYALGALERHGAVRGTALAVWRVLRCNPLSDGGYDPVPELSARGGARSGGRGPLSGPAMSDDGPDDPHLGGPTAGAQVSLAAGAPSPEHRTHAVRTISPAPTSQPAPMSQPVPTAPSAVPVTAVAGDARP